MGLVHTEARGQQGLASLAFHHFLELCLHVSLCGGYVRVTTGALRGQKRSLDLLELKLQGVVSLPPRGWE